MKLHEIVSKFHELKMLTHLWEVLVACFRLDVADEVAVVAVVGGVQQAQVVMPLLAVQLHAVGLVQGAVSDGRVVVAVPVGPDPV